jgi:hypothetical protein
VCAALCSPFPRLLSVLLLLSPPPTRRCLHSLAQTASKASPAKLMSYYYEDKEDSYHHAEEVGAPLPPVLDLLGCAALTGCHPGAPSSSSSSSQLPSASQQPPAWAPAGSSLAACSPCLCASTECVGASLPAPYRCCQGCAD